MVITEENCKMSKDDIKIFTGSGTFKVKKPQNKTDKPQYIQATGIVHDKCGTPECCQRCEPSKVTREKLN